MDGDQYADVRRTTVAEAAQVLGISAEAVRGRIRRGTLPVEREGGAVYVLLSGTDRARTTTDQPRTTDQPDDRTDALIAELQDRVRSLEESNRENRRIIAALTSRIPELPAATTTEARESPEMAADEQQGRGPIPDARGPQEPSEALGGPGSGTARGSWWRRMFGG